MASGERKAIGANPTAERMAIVVFQMPFPRVVAVPAKRLEVGGIERELGNEAPRSLVIHSHLPEFARPASDAIRKAPDMFGAELAPLRRGIKRPGLGLSGKIYDRHFW